MAHTIDGGMMREAFSRRSALLWLLVANCAIFVLLRLTAAAGLLTDHAAWGPEAVEALSLPDAMSDVAARPWSVLTYMFAQYDAAHLMFNMLWLAWFGIFVQCDRGGRQLALMYLAGGSGGALAYELWAMSAAAGSVAGGGLIGASASVMSVAVAITIIEPSRKMNLLFIGTVSLKWVAAAMIVIAVLFFSGYHAGSDAAHAGGAAAGIVYGLCVRYIQSRRTRQSARPVAAAKEPAAKKPESGSPATTDNLTDTELLDSLLDKIRRSGYDSLSADERATLFNLSQRIKN